MRLYADSKHDTRSCLLTSTVMAGARGGLESREENYSESDIMKYSYDYLACDSYIVRPSDLVMGVIIDLSGC